MKEQIFSLCNRFRWQSGMWLALSKFLLREWRSVCWTWPPQYYKLQHIYGISVGWNLVKNKRPVSDFFAFSLSLSLINEHTAQSAFVLCVFSCMSGWGRARRADLSPEPITDGPIAQQPCFVDGELESCQVNPKSEKKNWRNVDGI